MVDAPPHGPGRDVVVHDRPSRHQAAGAEPDPRKDNRVGPDRDVILGNHRRSVVEGLNVDDKLRAQMEAKPKEITAMLSTGEEISISGAGLGFGANLLSDKAPPQKKIRRGAIIRVFQDGNSWIITQMPEVESAFVSVNSRDGAIRSLVGGFDFNRNKFNHVTQAWRQPGSSFKPFIYSSSLEKGLSPATIINDAPLTFTQTGGQVWQPKNYGGKFEGPISMRRALQKSINLVSIRILERVGVKYAQEYITRFGFDADKNPPYLTLALGAGNVTPLQMVGAYSVFANGGYKIQPYLIERIENREGKVIFTANPPRVPQDDKPSTSMAQVNAAPDTQLNHDATAEPATAERIVDARTVTLGVGGTAGIGASVAVISVGTATPAGAGAELNANGDGTLARVGVRRAQQGAGRKSDNDGLNMAHSPAGETRAVHCPPCHRGKVKATLAATRDGVENGLFSGICGHPHNGPVDWTPPRRSSDPFAPDRHDR